MYWLGQIFYCLEAKNWLIEQEVNNKSVKVKNKLVEANNKWDENKNRLSCP